MKHLVIYDTTGYIIRQMAGDVREPADIPFMWVEVPKGKRLVKIDTTKEQHEPLFEDFPKSEYEVELQKINDELDNIVNTIIMLSVPMI